jgi:hypothetical protein
MTIESAAEFDAHLLTRMLLAERGLQGAIARKGLPAPVQATKRWPVGRTHAWHNDFYKLARCTERRQIVADFYITLPWPTPSSWSADSYAKPGSSTAGTLDPAAGPDLLAHSLSPLGNAVIIMSELTGQGPTSKTASDQPEPLAARAKLHVCAVP